MTDKKITASNAFRDLIKTLCLSEFPCGIGSWRNPKDKFAEGQYSITMKDYGAQHEKMEVLQEYLNSGTWDVDTTWSQEAANLRSLAVSEPWKINKKFIWKYFRTLRLIDKQITEVDVGIKNLENLEELTLSVNKLDTVPSENLPPNVKVLELCNNLFQTVSSICNCPPNLLHLGLSYNLLASSQDYKYFTVEFWPSLMSLDLSYNNLVELVELIEKLATLPKLQNLVLLGNPLSLIPGYRGHVVDALRSLMILDDVHISADEKHHFKGLGKKKELILDEAHLSIVIGDLKGIPMPEELKEDEDRPEFPVITKTYLVQYQMLAEDSPKYNDTETQRTASLAWDPEISQPEERQLENVTQVDNDLLVFKTDRLEWDEDSLHFEYKKLHVTDELVKLKDYLNKGMKFSIIEEKTLSWPATLVDDEANLGTPDGGKRGKKDAGGKETPSKKGKDAKGKDKGAKGSAKDSKGKKKPGKDPGIDMRSDPPIKTEVGSYTVPLASFVEGESLFKKSCYCGGGPMPEVTIDENATPAGGLVKVDGSKSNLNKGGSKKSASPERGKSRKGSAGKKASRGGDKTRPPSNTSDGSQEDKPRLPPPITLSVKIELERWNTAADSMKNL